MPNDTKPSLPLAALALSGLKGFAGNVKIANQVFLANTLKDCAADADFCTELAQEVHERNGEGPWEKLPLAQRNAMRLAVADMLNATARRLVQRWNHERIGRKGG